MTLAGAESGLVLAEVFRSVLAYVGLKGEAGERLLDQMMTERRKAAGADCTLRFAAQAGELVITLTQAGHDWKMSAPVPVR